MSSQTIQLILWYISVGSNILPILMGIWAWREMNQPLWFVWATFILSIALAVSSITIAHMGGSTHWLFYAGPAAYGLLFGMAYRGVLRSITGRVTTWLIITLPVLTVAILLSYEGVKMLNLIAYTLLDALLVAVSLIWFSEQMSRPNSEPLRRNPWFWINLSTLLFWGFALITAFVESALFGYNQQLFNFFFFGLSPFLQFMNVVLVCIGFWRVRMNGLGVVKFQALQ